MNKRATRSMLLIAALSTAGIAGVTPAIAKTVHRPAAKAKATATYEVVLGNMSSRSSATRLQRKARAQKIDATIERDGKTNFEVEVDGYHTRAAAQKAADSDTRAGFPASTERS